MSIPVRKGLLVPTVNVSEFQDNIKQFIPIKKISKEYIETLRDIHTLTYTL